MLAHNLKSGWLPAALVLVTLGGFGLRVHDLGRKSLWYDELRQIEVARLPPTEWAEALKGHAARPLDYAITRGLLTFTHSEWLLRLPALAWGTLAIPVVYRLGRRLLGRAEGAIGTYLFASSSLAVTFSQELRPYGLYALAGAASFWMLDLALRRGTRAAWLGYAAALGLGVMTHYFWLVILAGQALYVAAAAALKQLPAWRLVPFAASVAAGCAVLLATSDPLVVLPLAQNYLSAIFSAATANQPPPVSLRAVGFNPYAPTLTYDFFVRRVLAQLGAGEGPALLWFNALLLIGLAGSTAARQGPPLGAPLARFDRRLPVLLAWLLVGPALIVGYLLYRNEIFAMRYVLFALPPYLLLVARGIVVVAGWADRALSPGWRLAPGIVLAALAGFTWLNAGYVADYYRAPKDDWRRIGRFLEANVQPGDAIFAPNVQAFVEFYFPGAAEFLVYADSKREAQVTYGQYERTWFVMSDWVTYDITDTRKVVDLYPGATIQWDASARIKFTHRGRSEAEILAEAAAFDIPAPSLPEGRSR